mmetsp:Transcript_10456/g.63914  ORF Transcript_10456/g.63914 Transcript_10456/m.63914 type:complete len:115 (-) Transcript_10456:2138-2482(-)
MRRQRGSCGETTEVPAFHPSKWNRMDPGKTEGRLDLLCLLNGWKEGRFFTTVWADSPVPSLNQCTFRTDLPCTAAASADAKEGAFYFRERIGLDRMWVGCSCASRLDSRGSFVT